MPGRARKGVSALGSGLGSLLSREEEPEAEPVIPDSPPQAAPAAPEATPELAPPDATVLVEDGELLQSFIQEAHEHLQTMEGRIVALEKGSDADNVNAIFRCMHTIKGNSSFLSLTAINRLSHRLESVLDALRNGKIQVTPEVIDVLLSGTDTLLAMIGGVEEERTAIQEANPGITSFTLRVPEVESASLLTRVGRVLQEKEATVSAPPPVAPTAQPTSDLVTDEIAQRFSAETADLLDTAERAFLDLEKDPTRADRVDEAFRSIHTIKGNAGFMGFAEVESACMKTEGELEEIRSGSREPTPSAISALLAGLDRIRRALSPGGSGKTDLAGKPVGEILVGLGATTPEEVDRALEIQERRVGEILVDLGKVSPESLNSALEVQKRPAAQTEATARKDIRVDTAKLDKLFDLMGELITAETMLINNPEIRALELEGFAKSAGYLSKITREMQEITLSVRMIPLEGLFTKMRRLVRDLARKSGKNIDLRVSGQETEMDRNVIEEISDPLVHLIRNSIDHGVEPEEVRRSSGKPAEGILSLGARYEGNEIWVSVADDGAGLNRGRIVAKAKERGMLTADPDTLSDEQVWSFIFEPGFSTAATVSDVSGRGVGMDVVKRNMDKLRAKVDILSTAGSGTQIILKIPLTLAIIDGVSVRVGSARFEIPLADVVVFHKAATNEVTRTGTEREVVRLRGSLIPVVRLHDFFHVTGANTEIHEGILLVTQRGGARAALLVDEIVGYQQIVVKPLPQYLAGLAAISGCSILGNGEVSLIVDTGALIKAELQ